VYDRPRPLVRAGFFCIKKHRNSKIKLAVSQPRPYSNPAMKTITFEETCQLIDKSAAVIIDGTVTYMNIDEDEITASWTDCEGDDYEYTFSECDNQIVVVEGDSIFLREGYGADKPEKIILLRPWKELESSIA